MPRKVILLGCGGVGKCALYYLPRFLRVSYDQVVIIDRQITPKSFPTVQHALKKGAKYIHFTITARNFEHLLTHTIKCNTGDIILDLTTRTDCNALFRICRRLQLHYINTSVEQSEVQELSSVDHIWMQHAKIREIAERTKHYGSATTCIEMGMNPGLISIFVKQGILDIARYIIKHKQTHTKQDAFVLKSLRAYVKTRDYRRIGELLQINTIHCSEIDTQTYEVGHQRAFLNTWSCLGLVDEAFENVEVSMGTHEKDVPFQKKDVKEIVPGLVTIAKPSSRTMFRSYLPKNIDRETGKTEFMEIKGPAIHHGEVVSLNRFLATDTWVPTMHYVYQMAPQTKKALHDMSEKQLIDISNDTRKWKVLNMHDDQLNGTDNVGATFFLATNPITGERKPWAYWCGTMLDTHYTSHVLKDKYFGPTTIQVIAGMLSAAKYVLRYPDKGLLFPEDIPESFILKHARRYLGNVFSGPIEGCKIRGTTMKDLFVGVSRK
jgi:homospermidine synthase